jgi:Holliday junction resolvase-like predicted endonuclease
MIDWIMTNKRKGNVKEKLVARALRRQGYTVLSHGWPDLLAYRDKELRFIEVKSKGCTLAANQRQMRQVLFKFFRQLMEVIEL